MKQKTTITAFSLSRKIAQAALVFGLCFILVSCQTAPKQKTAQVDLSGLAGTQGNERLLLEIDAYLNAGDASQARSLLRRVSVNSLDPAEFFRYQLAVLRFYQLGGNFKQAEGVIQESGLEFLRDIPMEDQVSFFVFYAGLLEEQGNIRDALRILTYIDARIASSQSETSSLFLFSNRFRASDLADIHKEIVRLLEKMPVKDLLLEASLARDNFMRGWYDFGLIRHLDSDYARVAPTEHWQKSYPRHPAREYFNVVLLRQRELLRALEAEGSEQTGPSTSGIVKVAFMLPFTSSTLGSFANAIVSGYHDMAQRYGVRVDETLLDTAGDASFKDLYAQAEDADNDLILGPLQKERVDELRRAIRKPDIPVVVLNDPSRGGGEENFYIYSYNFEENVATSAQLAWDNQCRNIGIMASDTDLGARGGREFGRAWKQLGGNVEAIEITGGDRKITELVSNFMGVTNQDVSASKAVYRKYLVELIRLGVEEELTNQLLRDRTPKGSQLSVSKNADEDLFISFGELNQLGRDYYGEIPSWKVGQQENREQALKELLDGIYGERPVEGDEAEEKPQEPKPDAETGKSYTREDLEQTMSNFWKEIEESFERANIDCVFLAMDSIAAAEVRPFFSFYLANDIPIFGSFLLYDRSFTPSGYADLEGITYPEMPLLLESIKRLEDDSVYAKRFYLMGRDAFLLQRTLPRLRSDLYSALSKKSQSAEKGDMVIDYYVLGAGGLLAMKDNKIARTSRPMFFSRGLPTKPRTLSIFH